jgi:phospholipase C
VVRNLHRSIAAAGFCLLAACAQHQGAPTFAPLPTVPNAPLVQSPIRHVVVIVQENRSFDNLFYNFPGADSAPPTPLQQVNLEDPQDVCHFHTSFEAAYDGGKLDGFGNERLCAFVKGVYQPTQTSGFMYAHVNRSEIQPYWTLASSYTLGDRMFQSNSGPSFPAHQYLIAGQSGFADEVPTVGPWGCDAPAGTTVNVLEPNGTEVTGPFPCFNYTSLATLLDAAGVTWKYYTPSLTTQGGLFSAYDAVRPIRYSDDWNTKVISPETQVLSDISTGQLPSVSWVIPSFPNSDHPLSGSNTGPDWVASVVNSIGSSQYWSDTAIFIVWDDWGGWYDHVAPPQIDRMGLGFRVPLIVVSPYAKHGYVSHTQHEFGSILKFVEDNFNLPSLGQADARADNLIDCFDFTQSVSPYTPVTTQRNATFFLRERHVPGGNDPA